MITMKSRSNRAKKGEKKGFITIHGLHAVVAALQNPKRKHQKLIISSSNSGILNQKIRNSVNEIVQISNKEMSKSFGGESSHQGIILTTSNIKQPIVEEILNTANLLLNSQSIWKPHVLMLLGDYFVSKGENLKAKEFYQQILVLNNLHQNMYEQAQSQLINIANE